MPRTKHKPQIVPSQIGIGSILKTYWLRVPPHQREYRWTNHVRKLFEDLQHAQASDQHEYFLGTIVTIPDAEGVLEVIDGQQRLATIAILISRIRHYLQGQGIDTKLASSLDAYLGEYSRAHKTDVPKIRLNLIDNAFFTEMLSSAPPHPELPATAPISHKRIRNAFIEAEAYIAELVKPANKNTHGDVLAKWLDFLETDAEVILFRVPTGANAYKMFETLNDRGLKTTQADLVKSYLFGQAGDQYQEVQSSWARMIGALSSLQGEDDDIDDDKEDLTVVFLRTALMAIRGFLTRGQVFEVVTGLAQGPQSAVTLIGNLERLAIAYEATFFQDHEMWKSCPDSMRKAIQTINFFDIKPFRPTLLAIAAKFAREEAARAFLMFVSLGVRLLIAASTRTGSVEQGLASAAHRIFDGVITTGDELKKELSALIPTDGEFSQAFQRATVTSGPHARYYLRAMERVAQTQPFPWWIPNEDKESMTLEHVLPLNPEDNWPQFIADEVKLHAKRIGNMCLLPKALNCDLRNADQQTKYAVYKAKNCPYELTRQITEAPVWDVAAINKRQEGLAKLALRAWPL